MEKPFWEYSPRTKHGHNTRAGKSPTFLSWDGMMQRCRNPRAQNYARYGGRGITIDQTWLFFENFLRDMGERPAGKTLDRIDCNGSYTKNNCRWATPKEQSANRRINCSN